MTGASRRRRRILDQLPYRDESPGGIRRLCEVAVAVTGVSGAGITLITDGMPRGSVGVTDGVAGLIEDLQYTLGEGPSIEAHHTDAAVLEPDLAAPGYARWIAFAPPAAEAGAAAVFGFPLRVAASRLGVLGLYRDRPGPLDEEELSDALLITDIMARRVLRMRLDAGPDTVDWGPGADADLRLVVHQASGMVSVQLGSSVAEAMLRLRGRAFATGRPIADVAEGVVARRIRFTRDPDEGPSG